MQKGPYFQVLTALLFQSTRTRPDITTAVPTHGKPQEVPVLEYCTVLKHVVRSIKGSADMGVIVPPQFESTDLCVWCTANWAQDRSNRLSRSGIIITINSAAILSSSKLQATTALSTTKAEFAALSTFARDVILTSELLKEVGQAFLS